MPSPAMLNFDSVRGKQITIDELCAQLTPDDLRRLTSAMIDTMLDTISTCVDGDVGFVPVDPHAEDPHAETAEEYAMPWTLGHVIVHVTASSEEAAFLAAELARGVPYREGRSRYELPWQSIATVDQCRRRLEESRRMRLASLDLWPEPPHLDNLFPSWRGNKHYNAVVRFVFGLWHDHNHLEQIREIVRQAQQARILA